MADDKDKDTGVDGDGKAGPDVGKIMEALKALGVDLPDDTTLDNLTDRLVGAAAAKGGMGDEPPPDADAREVP